MKKALTSIAIFAGGLGLGFFAGKKFYQTKYQKLAEKEIREVVRYYADRDKKDNVKEAIFEQVRDAHRTAQTARSEEVRQARKNLTNTNPLTRSSLDDNPYEQAKRNYHLVNTESVYPEELDEGGQPVKKGVKQDLVDDGSFDEDGDSTCTDAAGMTEEHYSDEDPAGDPFIISAEDFITGRPDYDKISLYYYRGDDILCEENESVMDDEYDWTVGWDCFAVLENEQTVWVRNPRLRIDYEIMGVNGTYAEVKYGVPPNESPRERYLRESKRKRTDVDDE